MIITWLPGLKPAPPGPMLMTSTRFSATTANYVCWWRKISPSCHGSNDLSRNSARFVRLDKARVCIRPGKSISSALVSTIARRWLPCSSLRLFEEQVQRVSARQSIRSRAHLAPFVDCREQPFGRTHPEQDSQITLHVAGTQREASVHQQSTAERFRIDRECPK
jgi:hypothetical protein